MFLAMQWRLLFLGYSIGASGQILSAQEQAPTHTSSIEYYDGTAGPVSKHYSVKLINRGNVIKPHVYGIQTPADRDTHKDCTSSWVEFGQDKHETTTVQVTTLKMPDGFPVDVHIRPKRYGIHLHHSRDRKTVTFNITGFDKHVSVHFGTDRAKITYTPVGAQVNSMFIWVSRPQPPIPSSVLEYKPGEHYIHGSDGKGTGILHVTGKHTAIHFHRGAWVYGKVQVDAAVDVYGTGVIDAAYFSYSKRHTTQSEHVFAYGPGGSSNKVWGLTVVNGNKMLLGAFNSGSIVNVRALGWSGNNDGVTFGGNVTAESVFIRTSDDVVKLYHTGKNAHVTLRDLVLWGGPWAALFQMGYGPGGARDMSWDIYNATIIDSEYVTPSVGHGNRAMVACTQKRGEDSELLGPFNWYDTQVDAQIGTFLNIKMGAGTVKNLNFHGVNIAGLTGWNGAYAPSSTGHIRNINFHDFIVGGRKITSLKDDVLNWHQEGDVKGITIDSREMNSREPILV